MCIYLMCTCFIAMIHLLFCVYAVVFHSTTSVSTFMLSCFITSIFFFSIIIISLCFKFTVHPNVLNRDYWRVRAALPTSCVWPNVTSFHSSRFIPVLFKNNSIHFWMLFTLFTLFKLQLISWVKST
jgi:hypothetical protein